MLHEQGEQTITIYAKGADNIIFERANAERFVDELNAYAMAGLRTLVWAKRTLQVAEAAEWTKQWRDASTRIAGR
jgi:magnesium-transporting ATPase (P-type)